MAPAGRAQRRLRAGIAALLATATLALVAHFELARRSTGREIARLTTPRDRLRSIADRLETQRREAESDRRMVFNVLRQCRSAEDIPDLRCNRVVALHQGVEKLCIYVPAGSHTLEVSSTGRRTPKANPSGEPPASDAAEPEKKSWSVPLLPGSGYLFKVVSDRKDGPIYWELSSNHPDFQAQAETVLVDGFSQRGFSWSGTDVVQFPNQIERVPTGELEAAATARAGVNLMSATLNGVRHDAPYEIAFNVRLRSATRACVSASDAQGIIVLGKERLLEYAGEGKYELRIPE